MTPPPSPLPILAEDLLDTVPEPLLMLTADLRVRRANRSFYRTFAVTPEETAGRLVYELGNGQWDIPALRRLLEGVLPQQETFDDFEVVHDFPSVGRKMMLLNARRVVGEGRAATILLAIEDITERRRLEDERREIESRFTSLVKNVRDHSIFALDPHGHVTSWNTEAERILGFGEEEVLGRHFSMIFTEEDKQNGIPAHELRTALNDGRAEDERWHVRKGGERFWALGIVTPIHDASGKHTGFSKILRDMTDRKRAEEVLTESERRFRALATASGSVLYQLSPDWSELQPLDGKGLVPSNDAPIRGWFERNVAPADQPAVRERIAHAIATKTPFAMEHRTNRPDGSIGWTFSSAVPLLDAGGAITEWVGAAGDVTARKQAEEGLRRAHDTFYNLIQNNPFGIYVVDGDFRLREVSLGAQKVFAGVPRPLLGRDFAEVLRAIWAEPFASEAIRLFRHTFDTGEPYTSPRTVERRQDLDEVEAYDWRMERIILPDGRFGVVCYFYDLSERQRWEAALRESEERHRRLIETAYEGIWTIDAAGRTTYVNRRMAELLGYAPQEIIGRVHTDFMWEQDRPTGDVAMEGRRQGMAAVWDQRYRRKDGGELWTVASCSSLHDATGKFVGALGMFTDITDRKRAEGERQALLEGERAARAEAERASRMKDEFLATLSHELRTPLNAILGWSQILRSGGPADPDDIRQGLETIERNARAQTAIIEDLLDMSRIISGKVRLDVQRIDLPPVVQAAVDTVRPAAEAKGVRLQVILDPLAGPVSGDPNRLQQVFWNLLRNAVKFTPRGGRVQVLLERVNSHLEVSVIDTGEGISPDFLPFVFDRFRQSDASTTRRHGGLGLGLAIVKQLVEMHGGDIRAKSGGVGMGSTFIVSIPLTVIHADPDAVPVAERRHPVAGPGPQMGDVCVRIAGLRVLVVDDEPDARVLVKRFLTDCDAIVTTAGSAREGLELLRAQRPDVLVSDIGMPNEDGYALIGQVRALRPEDGGDTPAIALTAYARAEDRMRAITAGFQHHVVKPVEPAELITMVASLAKSRKAPP